MTDARTPETETETAPASKATPAAELLALGLGRTEAFEGHDGEDDEDDEELERFLCALPDLELHGCLGRGGMGRVYRARQIRLDRFVAVKLMNAELGDDPEFRERFEREARALARLDHPGVVRVHDFGEAGGVFYLVMELVDGPSLREIMAAGIEPEAASRIVGQLCDALAYAHARGVVHRDIKPENVLLDRSGQVKVADFGLAKLQQVDHRATTRRVVGTPQYMAPEQLNDPGSVDHRADVFAIGVVLYEMLTGQLPVGRFPTPSELGHGDATLDRVVLRALESNRDKRYQAASEIRVALESRAVDDPDTRTRPDLPTPASPASRRRWWLAGGAVAAAAAASITAVALSSSGPEPELAGEVEPTTVATVTDGGAGAASEVAPEDAAAPVTPPPSRNRWPASDIAMLADDTAVVLGVDIGELRQAPALATLQAGLGKEVAWQRCYANVISKTHKMIIAFDDEGSLTEVIAHGDWPLEAFEPCLSAQRQTGADTGEAEAEPPAPTNLGDYRRYAFTDGEGTPHEVVLGRVGARVFMTFREDMTEDGARARFGPQPSGTDIGDRLGNRVDLDAPLWVLADRVPDGWEGTLKAGWGHVDLWEQIEVDATLVFDSEPEAEKAAKMIDSYATIVAAIDDAPEVDVKVEHDGDNVTLRGRVEIPEDLEGSFALRPGTDEPGVSIRFDGD